jgi:DNA-binding LytR/AlgR family response regulator
VAISNWLLGLSIWICINYYYYIFIGVSKFNYTADATAIMQFRQWLIPGVFVDPQSKIKPSQNADASLSPRLLKRLKNQSNSEVLALVAEDHYTRVIYAQHDELIYLKFRDAIAEMEGQGGLQTHRSYWVSLEAIEEYCEQRQKTYLILSNEMTVPVSRSFKHNVKESVHTLDEGKLAR